VQVQPLVVLQVQAAKQVQRALTQLQQALASLLASVRARLASVLGQGLDHQIRVSATETVLGLCCCATG
jgi:hypothetical protein